MLTIRTIAAILLIFRLISMFFIIRVAILQFNILKTSIQEDLIAYRKVLFRLSLSIILFNIVPILIDSLTLFVTTNRPATLQLISIAYAVSNASSALVSAIAISTLYKLAARAKITKK